MIRYSTIYSLIALTTQKYTFSYVNQLITKIIGTMQKENQTPQNQNVVMFAVAQFLSALWMEGEFKYQPDYLAEIFEDILKTEIGNDVDLRTKMLSCIKTSKMLAKALDPFTDQEIEKACVNILNPKHY